MPEYSDALAPFTDDAGAFETAAARTRAAVRPPGGRQEGLTTKFAAGYVPHVIEGMASLPQRATESASRFASSGEYDPAPIIEAATMLYGANAPFVPKGAVGIFGGKLAKTADLDKLKTAQDMASAGASPNHIWHNTGWFEGADGKWRFEIPDEGAAVRGPTALMRSGKLEDFMSHPALYEACPDARRMSIAFKDLPTGSLGEVVSGPTTKPFDKRMALDATQIATAPEYGMLGAGEGLRRVMLHEVQHPIQRAEGHTPGGSPAGVLNMLRSRMREVQQKIADGTATPREIENASNLSDMLAYPEHYSNIIYKMYDRLLGEVEARNTEGRSRFNAHARQFNPPWLTWDTPTDRQIVPGKNRIGD